MRIKDKFEIKEGHQTGHAPGLVVVLDALAADDPRTLVGQFAAVRAPTGQVARFRIEEAKNHGPVNSLFFRDVSTEEVPLGSEVIIQPPSTPEARVGEAFSTSPHDMKGIHS